MKKLICFILLSVMFSSCEKSANEIEVVIRDYDFSQIQPQNEIRRLKPTDFLELPEPIKLDLQKRECEIPQAELVSKPNNVFQAQLSKNRTRDWAILCSRNGISYILIYWNGKTEKVDKIAKQRDSSYLQDSDGKGNFVFSRYIEPVSKSGFNQQASISDSFIEKASVIHHYKNGKWVELPGAD